MWYAQQATSVVDRALKPVPKASQGSQRQGDWTKTAAVLATAVTRAHLGMTAAQHIAAFRTVKYVHYDKGCIDRCFKCFCAHSGHCFSTPSATCHDKPAVSARTSGIGHAACTVLDSALACYCNSGRSFSAAKPQLHNSI